MIILNLGCGFVRPGPPWINIDNLYAQFPDKEKPERIQLDKQQNYCNADLSQGIPFGDNHVDGCLLSHLLEHMNCQDAVKLLTECYRVLKPNGYVCCSVPDCSYFRKVYDIDCKETQMDLFGEKLDRQNPWTKMFDAALFFNEHLQLLSEDGLWCLLTKAGFKNISPDGVMESPNEDFQLIKRQLNRHKFSSILWAVK